MDPLTGEYPWYTPYQFAGNKPIRFIDLDGLEEADPNKMELRPVNSNTSESTCIGCSDRKKEYSMSLFNQNHGNLKNEYQKWKSDLSNIGKAVPEKFKSVAEKLTEQTVQEGGYYASKEYLIAKARVDVLVSLSEYAPVVGDLHDIKDVFTNARKGDFVAAGLSAVFLIPGTDGLKPIKSLVKSDKQLLKYARDAFEGNKMLSKEATDLVDKFRKGLDGGVSGHSVLKASAN